MSAQKRKRTDFTLKEKNEIIYAAKKKPNQSKLAREISKIKWGVEVERTTVKGILSKKLGVIEAAIKAGVPSKRMKLTQAHDPKLDEGVLVWLEQARGQNLSVSGDLIKEKAMKQRSGKPGGVMQACDRLDNEMHVIHQKKLRQRRFLRVLG